MPASRGVQLLLLTFAVGASSYARAEIGALLETLRAALELSDHQIALLQGPALAISLVLAAIPLGILIDRYNRQRTLFAFVLLSAVGSVLTAQAPGFAALFVGRLIVGLSANAISLAAWSMISDLYAKSARGRAGTALVIGQAAGMGLAFWAGGELVTILGAAEHAWRAALWLMTIPIVLVMLAMLMIREPPRHELTDVSPSLVSTIGALWRIRRAIAPVVIAMVMVEIAFQATWVWAAPVFSRTFGLSPQSTGSLLGASMLFSGVLGPLAGGALADLCQRTGGPHRSMMYLCVLTLISAAAAPFGVMPAVASASVLLIAFMTIACAIFVMTSSLIIVVVPNELRGVCLALSAGMNAIFGVGLAPLIVSGLSGVLGGPAEIGKALALVSTSVCVVGAAIFFAGRRTLVPEPTK